MLKNAIRVGGMMVVRFLSSRVHRPKAAVCILQHAAARLPQIEHSCLSQKFARDNVVHVT